MGGRWEEGEDKHRVIWKDSYNVRVVWNWMKLHDSSLPALFQVTLATTLQTVRAVQARPVSLIS